MRSRGEYFYLVLAYSTAEYGNNKDGYHEYYDEVEICQSSAGAHFKSAMQIRNWQMLTVPIWLSAALSITVVEHIRR